MTLAAAEAVDQLLTFIEFQFQKDDMIFTRTVAEMVAIQEANLMRPVQSGDQVQRVGDGR